MEEYKIFKNNTTKWVVGILAGLLLLFVVLFSQQIENLFDSLMGQAQEQSRTMEIGQGKPTSWSDVEAGSTNIDPDGLSQDTLRIHFPES